MRPKRWAVVALGMTLVIAAGACGDGGGGAADGEDEIVLGASAPLTGPRSEGGEAVRQGYTVWEELVNEAGGILGRPVRVIVTDDGGEQERTRANYQALIDRERVDALLGTFSSLQNEPASALAEQRELLFVCPSCGAPDLFRRGFHHFFFAQPATSDHQTDLFAKWVAGLPEGQRPATAAYPILDDPFTVPVIESLRTKLEAVGVQTVYDPPPYAPDLPSLEPIASAVANSRADLVAHGATVADGIGMLRAFQRVGYSPKILYQSTAPSLGDQFADGVGAENTEGIFYAVSWSPDAATEGNAEFVERYELKYDQSPPEDAANAFGAAQVVQAAIEGVGSLDDQTALADWLHEHTVATVMGPLSWDEAGRPQGEYLIAQWQRTKSGYESTIVLPRELANTDQIVHPKPAWR